MKNRKMAIVAFFLVAVLCIGAGYAVLTDILDIQGVANETGNTAEVNTNTPDKATFTVNTLAGKGDKATFTFTIKNENDGIDADVATGITRRQGGNLTVKELKERTRLVERNWGHSESLHVNQGVRKW